MFPTAGLPEPVPPLPPAAPFVAIAVGKTKEGESLPAKPIMVKRSRRSVNHEVIGVNLIFVSPSLEKPVPLD